jgi:hypothetical protein
LLLWLFSKSKEYTQTQDHCGFFLWGDSDEQKKMHWCTWWRMCTSQKEGDMGFRDHYTFNLAMLAKQT